MKRKNKIGAAVVGVAGAFGVLAFLLHGLNVPVLMPKGIIAHQQFSLLLLASALMLIVVVPVLVLTFVFSWRYRAGNHNAPYTPDWDGDRKLEAVWWIIPMGLILVLSVITWETSHTLDPYRPISSLNPSVTVQVVATDWKWVFIYPKQGIATVNYLQIPENTPINFQITSDAAMNSFWIPQLGGQIYAMAGMSSQLHLMADGTGTYDGSSANLSGRGFSGMRFKTDSVPRAAFDAWVRGVKRSGQPLTGAAYDQLARPSTNHPVQLYSPVEAGLYDTVMRKYMAPGQNIPGMEMSH